MNNYQNQFKRDLKIRGFSGRTIGSYVRHVDTYLNHYNHQIDPHSSMQVKDFFHYLMQERNISRSYTTSARLEKAYERSLYYRHHRNSSTIGWILEKDYDRLVLSPHIDLRGEFIYSFEPLTPEDQNNVESRIPRDKMAE